MAGGLSLKSNQRTEENKNNEKDTESSSTDRSTITNQSFVAWANSEPRHYPPKGVMAVGQLKKVVVKCLNENSTELHTDASGLVLNELYYAFPPSRKDDGTHYRPE